jgi:hypothetical protein
MFVEIAKKKLLKKNASPSFQKIKKIFSHTFFPKWGFEGRANTCSLTGQ